MAHNVVTFTIAWFSIAGYCIRLFIIGDIIGNPPESSFYGRLRFKSATPIIDAVLRIIYLFALIYQFIMAVGSRPTRTENTQNITDKNMCVKQQDPWVKGQLVVIMITRAEKAKKMMGVIFTVFIIGALTLVLSPTV
ncbi:uncharacterized protein B0H64DRAFT_64223 [Chaetomium fimeti]|uniref:Uncharacterized protein n=1 Tax=Chaetomium fimeti TaxID=1854472 RepID=A0AAE0H5A4_9PEZI|nr:hypothetical protein B0H64DRAFT_64223 [Chaetomium fimeti]